MRTILSSFSSLCAILITYSERETHPEHNFVAYALNTSSLMNKHEKPEKHKFLYVLRTLLFVFYFPKEKYKLFGGVWKLCHMKWVTNFKTFSHQYMIHFNSFHKVSYQQLSPVMYIYHNKIHIKDQRITKHNDIKQTGERRRKKFSM